jgi:hypothetical protein
MSGAVVRRAQNSHAGAASGRAQLLRQMAELARKAIYGTLSESFRTCGNKNCRCHHGGPKHGPHLSISYRGAAGKTTGYYVPKAAEAQIREGVEAWSELQTCLHALAALNKQQILPPKPSKRH